MFQKLKAAWQAGRSGQPMPTTVDRSTGQTAAVVGIAGIAVLVVFGTAYGFGRVERHAREVEDKKRKAITEDDASIEGLSSEIRGETITADHLEEKEVDYKVPPGSAACPVCGSVYTDPRHATDCCEDKREYEDGEPTLRQDPETGEITDPEDDDPEPEDAEDLWERHVGPAAQEGDSQK